ncbi:MAG TPA: NADP-dependent oxidoreductase [Marmoricola sp.]|nr:NADP-dependent oxidoreductase [Marmoricola sp.]
MRAVVITGFGAEPELAELPVPVPAAGEILVRMHAAGMNPFDWKVSEGALRGVVEHRFPVVMGSDGAGVVEAVGADVDAFRVGDRVFGQFMKVALGRGSYADHAVAAADGKLARIPDGLSFEVAAALPTASVTAYQAVRAAGLAPGQTLVVNGASGGVGQSAVQLAGHAGVQVVATSPPDLSDHLRDLGAAEVVDFTRGATAEQVRAAHPDGVDAVLDLVSKPGEGASLAALVRSGGVVLSTNGALDPDALAADGVRGVNFFSDVTPDDLAAVAALAVTGRLRVTIDATVSLADAPAAVARARSGHARGKTVILL